MTNQKTIIPVILCGGSGTRLWPLSREKLPKQFHTVIGEGTMMHQTLSRAVTCSGARPSDIISVTAETIAKETLHQLQDFDPASATHILKEPAARNTAAAIAYAALYAQKKFGNHAILWIVPADHYIDDENALTDMLQNAASLAQDGLIVTFGMTPERPETGYGYIQYGAALNHHGFKVSRFAEKPDRETAEDYLASGNYLWNSGMFVGTVQTLLDQYIEHAPSILSPLHHAMKEGTNALQITYPELPSIPFDIAIMEKTDKAAVIPCQIGWSDVGSWQSVWELKDKDDNGNAKDGRVAAIRSENCLLSSNRMLMAAVGLKDIVAIENGDSILIAHKDSLDSIKELNVALKKMGCPEAANPPMESRPWGQFKVLSQTDGYKVKEIIVKPGAKLSLQMHHHRCEFWTVISGQALVTIDGQERILNAQESTFIPLKAVHRVENIGTEPMIMVEVQCGDYLGEDDIVRFDDIYGRIEAA